MSEKMIQGVLAAFSFGCISGSKRNPTITREILDEKNAGDDAGAWSDRLFPKKSCGAKNAFTALRTHLGQMRAWHYSSTFVFEDSIWRILPEKRIQAYKQVVELDGREHATELLNAFCKDLPDLIAMARIGRGDAFKESDYPDEEQVRSKFSYAVDYRPVPTSAGLNPALMQEAIDKLNALHQQRLAEANITLVTRFVEPFKLLAEQLKDPTKRKIGPVLERIREFAAVVPSLDLSGNQELISWAQQVEISFSDLSADAIKKDAELATLLGTTCQGVVAALDNFGKVGQGRKIAA